MTSNPISNDSPDALRAAARRFLDQRVDHERAVPVAYHGQAFKLDRMRRLLELLGNPHLGLPVVHVAGTKGKGSTSAAVAGILTAAGYRTGLYTSPHLEQVEERIAVDATQCTADEFGDLLCQVRPHVERLDRESPGQQGPTFFEITTAMALLHFVQRRADAAVLEVGLGGRLDSTNVCQPRVCIITNISLDHTQLLGDTVEAIAREKGGIIKPGIPLVSGVLTPGPKDVIHEICQAQGAPLHELDRDFSYTYTAPQHAERKAPVGRFDFRYHRSGQAYEYADLPLRLLGRHQAANAALALGAIEELRQSGYVVRESAVRAGLDRLAWPARVELVRLHPAVVIDAAHNVASIAALVETLRESLPARHRRLLFGTTRDKDVPGMLRPLLDAFDDVVFTRYHHNPRAVPPEELASVAQELTGRRWPACDDPVQAWKNLRSRTAHDDLLCVTGSFFLAAELRRLATEG